MKQVNYKQWETIQGGVTNALPTVMIRLVQSGATLLNGVYDKSW